MSVHSRCGGSLPQWLLRRPLGPGECVVIASIESRRTTNLARRLPRAEAKEREGCAGVQMGDGGHACVASEWKEGSGRFVSFS